MVVAGGQGDVHFWERRTRQKLETFDDMHMDDVTQVVMHAASRKLLTASQDGLVAVHDMAAGPNQDDGFEVGGRSCVYGTLVGRVLAWQASWQQSSISSAVGVNICINAVCLSSGILWQIIAAAAKDGRTNGSEKVA